MNNTLVETKVRNRKNKIYRRVRMIIKFMSELEEKVGQSLFKEIISMAEKDIKFNRVNLRKLTTQKEFILICQKYYKVLTT